MDPEGGRKADAISQDLVEHRLRTEPWKFDFFQAVRLLGILQPGRSAVGQFSHPLGEIARFTTHASLSFPASQIQSLTWDSGSQPSMSINFMGLVGPLGVLPVPYTELVIERRRSRDTAFHDFLDLFNHRAASLFYQAWEKSRFMIGYERGGGDPLTAGAFALFGLGTSALQNRQRVRDESLLFYSGLFDMATRPAVALESILADYFDVDIEIEQFVGVWRQLDAADCCVFEEGEPESYQLGLGAVVGNEIWDQQSRARIRIGPLTAERYRDFLPTGAAYEPLRALTKTFSGDEIEFEVQLILKREEVPPCRLGDPEADPLQPDGPALGWQTWLNPRAQMNRNPSDTILLI
jgi:type VI secretion system protein ImpH